MLSRAWSRFRARSLLRAFQDDPAFKAGRRIPILYVPGMFGTKFYDRDHQVFTWADYRGLLFRRPGEADFAPDAQDPQRVLANEVLHEFRMVPGLWSSLVTREVVDCLELGLGYRLHTDLFFLAYDWRKDFRTLGSLVELEIARIRAQFGPEQKIILIGQSIANMGLRYWLRQCDARNRQAIAKWYAFGPPWLGTWDAVHMLQEGYWPASRRHHGFAASGVARCPSVFQLLPAESCMVDHQGRPVADFDIFNARHWPTHGLPVHHADLQQQLDQAKDFAQAIAGTHEAEARIPQTWFVTDNNAAVSAALRGQPGQAALTLLSNVRKLAPELLPAVSEIGDDHFPLRHITQAPCGPLVRAPEAMPWGHNAVIISQSKDHRALINHGPNLQALVKDIATLHAAGH